jgi:tRNA threonylcarbamoyladenosine biosynthesis protein TsaE
MFNKIFIGKSEVQSPTYSLVNEYDNILHADLYRLEKKEDLIHLELPMYIEDKEYFLISIKDYAHAELKRLLQKIFFENRDPKPLLLS